MRKLIVHRERALACFAMKYHCIVNEDREEFLRCLGEEDASIHLWNSRGYSLRNGERISIPIGEEGCRFFVLACLDGRDIATETLFVPAGEEDAFCTVFTDFDGNKKLGIRAELNIEQE